jgi:hypothetical protein
VVCWLPGDFAFFFLTLFVLRFFFLPRYDC